MLHYFQWTVKNENNFEFENYKNQGFIWIMDIRKLNKYK